MIPFSEYPQSRFELQKMVQDDHDHLRPTIPPHTPPFFAKIISNCWKKDPEARPSWRSIIIQLTEQIGDKNEN